MNLAAEEYFAGVDEEVRVRFERDPAALADIADSVDDGADTEPAEVTMSARDALAFAADLGVAEIG